MMTILTATHLIAWTLATSLMARVSVCMVNYGRQYGLNFKPERKLG